MAVFSSSWAFLLESSTSANNDGKQTNETDVWSHPYIIIGKYIMNISYPFIFVLGGFGNVMTIVVMRRMSSKESIIQHYFIVLAITDLVVLFSAFTVVWLKVAFNVDLLNFNNPVCKIQQLLSGSTTLSAWYVMSLTVQRAMAVLWPHRINVLCDRRKVRILLVLIALFLTAFYAHYLYGFEMIPVKHYDTDLCWIKSENYVRFMENVFPYAKLAIHFVIPFVLMAAGNVVLIWKLKASIQETRHKLAQGDTGQIEAREKAANSVTLMVVVVSLTFVVLSLPRLIELSVYFFAIRDEQASNEVFAEGILVYNVSIVLMHANSAVNFYLYCLTGRKFRGEFLQLVSCSKGKQND